MKTTNILFKLSFCAILLACSEEESKYIELRDNSGNLIESHYELKDKLHGERIIYHKNGSKHQVTNHVNGSYQGKVKVFDTLGNLKEIYTEYYSKLNKQWITNEQFYYSTNNKIDNSKSFYLDIDIKDFCFELNAVTGKYSEKLDSSVLVVKYDSFLDVVIAKNNFNNYSYCVPKHTKSATIYFKAFYPIKDSVVLFSIKSAFGNAAEETASQTIIRNVKFN